MPLTWSISRENTLEACERRYFFEYVARARTNSRDGRLREIAVLKKVKTVSMWQGEVLHQLVAEYLRRGLSSRPDASRMIATAVEQMQRDWASSEKKRYREPLRGRRDGTSQDVLEDLGPLWSAAARGIESMPGAAGEVEDVAGTLALFEHEYDIASGADLLSRATANVELWFGRFLVWLTNERLVDQLRAARRYWIEPDVFGPRAPGFTSSAAQVITKVDLAIQRRDGGFVIYDWKTGIPRASARGVVDDDAEYQVTAYQLWPHLMLQVPMDAIEAGVVYLGVDPALVRSYRLDGDIRERALRRVRRGVRRGLALHGVGDHAPLGEADFDFAGHPALCRWCAFKRICQGCPSL
jgi:hypothetical protein